MNLFCLLFWILIVSKIRCVSEEAVNAFPEQEENEKIKIFKDFLESCDWTQENFSSVRAEQPSKVCSEEKLKIKVSDDFSQCQ